MIPRWRKDMWIAGLVIALLAFLFSGCGLVGGFQALDYNDAVTDSQDAVEAAKINYVRCLKKYKNNSRCVVEKQIFDSEVRAAEAISGRSTVIQERR